jgi:glycine/D-amino acid oxidase-like deaminating enzyme
VLTDHVECDVCVIGLGGSGLACAEELLAAGISVVGVDAGLVAGAAAGRNGGFLRAGLSAFHHEARRRHGAARAARLYRLTVAERERMLRDTPELVRRTGYLRLAHDAVEERDCRAHLAALREDDLAGEWHDADAGCGLLVPGDAVCDPLARCRAIAAGLIATGARLYERSPAVRISGNGIDTDAGRVRCRAVVVAVDGALGMVLPELAGRVRPARLQMLGTAAVDARFPHAVSARGGWDYWQQTAMGSLALGGCRDVGGEEEWTAESTPSPPVQAALERRLRHDLRVDAPVTHRWAATSGYTDTGLPVIEEVRPRVWAIGGYNGTGNLVGAACGRAAAALASGRSRETPFD